MITVIGFTLGIPDTVMGLTFIAAGVSVPDALSGIAVVREGQRDKLRGVFTIHSSVQPKPSFGVGNQNQGPISAYFFVKIQKFLHAFLVLIILLPKKSLKLNTCLQKKSKHVLIWFEKNTA